MKANKLLRGLMKAVNIFVVLMVVLNFFSWGSTTALAEDPSPRMDVWFEEGNIQAYDWPIGTLLTLTIDDPAPDAEDYSATTTVGPSNWDPTFMVGSFNVNGEYQMLPGMTVTVSGAAISKELVIANLVISSIDLDFEIITGTVDNDYAMMMYYQNHASDECCRFVQPDANGDWLVNYSIAGLHGEPTEDIHPGSGGSINSMDSDGDNTTVNWRIPNPFIEANPGNNWLHARDWPRDSGDIEVIIDDPATLDPEDFSGTATFQHNPNNPGDPNDWMADFNLGDFDLQGGFAITMTAGSTVISFIPGNLAVTNIDVDADTLTGIGEPNKEVQVCANKPGGCTPRFINTNGAGSWTADYGHLGLYNGEVLFNLTPRSDGWAFQQDDQGNQTWAEWRVPNPFIETNPGSNWVHGRDWPNGTTNVTMTIDDPATSADVDFENTVAYQHNPNNPGDPNDWLADFNLGGFDLKGGFTITMTGGPGGTTHLTYVPTNLAITTVDSAAETISGIGASGVEVQVCVNMPGNCAWRYVTPDDEGNWTVDYSQPGSRDDEQETVDLMSGNNGWAAQHDELGNQTNADWHAANPRLDTNPGGNWVNVYDWPNGAEVTLTIDNPSNGVGVDKTVNSTMAPSPWNPNDIYADFALAGYDLKAGDTLTVTDGTTTVTYVPTNLAITGFDLEADTLSGVGKADEDVDVCVNQPNNCVSRFAQWGEDDTWTVDYLGFVDLEPGTTGGASQWDENGNQTHADWRIPNPHLQANPGSNWIQALEWPLGHDLTLTIDDPSNGTGVDKTTHAVIGPAPWDANDTFVQFDLEDYVFHAGYTLSVTDGTTAVTYIPIHLAITGFNIANGIISGIAAPSDFLQVCANQPGNCVSRYVTPGANSTWAVDYSQHGYYNDEQELVVLQLGSNGWARQFDENDNQTWADWEVPSPYISDISNQNTNENVATGAIAFTIADANVAVAELTITAESSNPELLPNSNITLGGSGANRTITLTPAANQSGTTTITVTVNNGSNNTSDTFVLTVYAAPVITEGATKNVTVAQNTPVNLTLHATDLDSGDTITWSIFSAASHGAAAVSGTGTSKAIEYIPTHNYAGTDSFVVQVSDGHGLTTRITVNVTITPTKFFVFLPLTIRKP